jgi:hypothetical protein
MLGLAKRLFGRGFPWGPPNHNDLENYWDLLEESRREFNQFGRFNGGALIVDLSGFVEVIDPLDFMGVSSK